MLSINCDSYDFSEFNMEAVTDETVNLKIGHSTDDPEKPFLSISFEGDARYKKPDLYSNVTAYIDGYEKIDELRRYCEMVLAHIDRAKKDA